MSYSETVAAAQAALEPALEIDLSARQARLGGRVVRLPPIELAWLAWHARRRLRPDLPEGGATRWTEFEPDDFLTLYRYVANPAQVERVSQALSDKGMLKTWFEQRTAKLNKLVSNALGLGAAPYLLRTSGKRPNSRTGLALPPERIRWVDQDSLTNQALPG